MRKLIVAAILALSPELAQAQQCFLCYIPPAAAAGGSGTVTHTGGALTLDLPLLGAGADDIKSSTAANMKSVLSLGNVENTALSTWAGSANITTLGTIATGTWSATVLAPSKTLDPSTQYVFYEEFDGGDGNGGRIGRNGLNSSAHGSGTVTQTLAATTDGHFGTVRINSHATNDNSGYAIQVNGTAGNNATGLWGVAWSLDVLVMPGSNSTAITSTALYVGMTDRIDLAPLTFSGKAIWIRRDTDQGDTAFVMQVCDQGGAAGCGSAGDNTDTQVATSTITPSAGNWYRFRIENDPTGGPGSTRKISMRVNNETAITFCSSGCSDTLDDAPTGNAMLPMILYLTRTTTGVMSADVDYIYLTATGLSRY